MATFSPSPGPRRNYVVPPTRLRHSRLATPRAAADPDDSMEDAISVASASVAGMDVDEIASIGGTASPSRSTLGGPRLKAETVYAKSEELKVVFYAHLPIEVKQVLRNADFLRDAYTGGIDVATGFALIASAQTCFAWQHNQALAGAPTCYIFPCPLDPTQTCAPLHAFIPYSTSREPGLILISVNGEVRCWDSVGIGLAGGEYYSTIVLGLDAGEEVTVLTRAEPQTYVAATSLGRIFHLNLTSSGGRSTLSAHPFSRPSSGILSRLLFSSSSPLTEPGTINAICIGERSAAGKDVWALIDTRLQKWNMSDEGWEELLTDEELADIIRPALRDTLGSAAAVGDDARMDLELLDLAIERTGQLVILVSFAGVEDSYVVGQGSSPRRIYAIVRVAYRAGEAKVQKIGAVPYHSTSSSGAPMHPRMQVPPGGSPISIQFGDAVAFVARDSEYQDRLSLKSFSDRTLGLAIGEDEGSSLVLTAGVMMKATLDMERVNDFDSETGKARLIKSIMTQGILYGANPQNPLHFSLPPEVDEESLMSAAEQLSQQVLESDIEIVRSGHDLIAQMEHRASRLVYLCEFINVNGVLPKAGCLTNFMSQRSRQRLCTDSEKLFAAKSLWEQHNELVASGHRNTVLEEAIYSYMADVGEGHHEDLMRAFFRLKVADLGKILPKVLESVQKSAYNMNRATVTVLPEANHILCVILQTGWEYRRDKEQAYGVEKPMINPWTSTAAIVEVVRELFDITTQVVESPASAADISQVRAVPLSQLPRLAKVLFQCLDERIQWLRSPIAAEDPAAKRDCQLLEESFKQLRPHVLETLRRNEHADTAFALAEEYQDFRNLAALCHKDTVYPPHQNPHALRIQEYVQRFQEAFTKELFQWYIEHGKFSANDNIVVSEQYGQHIDRFFEEHPHRSIAWIHDLGTRNYAPASLALLAEAQSATDLESKELLLSIGKLSHLAQLHEAEGSIDEPTLNAFHDQLDLVSVHEVLLRDLKTALVGLRGKQSLEAQVQAIASKHASKLSEKKALLQVFKQLVRQLLQGRVLSIEDIVDVLTLKDNTDSVDDYATALHLLAREHTLPAGRRLMAFRSTWRRIFNHDDWTYIRQTVGVSDSEISERLQNTALCAALRATLAKPYHPPGYILQPGEALPVPTMAELESRWPGTAPEQLEEIQKDYTLESDDLGELELDDVYERARELAAASLDL
ncbi:hypothetical protein PUNSTDRAFT_71669 [Punctularia strigosozonata HHB-11173 SS5]|uniref:uncharacterized protein n=1 Tax=Punctularia strigosozonata (strain HHB-11173) TaxID=741275 RepID=UPI00044168CB|nr:uncharacterized protein PUNSTDRAFT_71669 [Punctularia strigosozonata HHB-11173 SS5]EIN07336.1 hypothetical protein PUNSTDRAFT_71669 [Punctularia strigosozonata HHB-11173 SS5]